MSIFPFTSYANRRNGASDLKFQKKFLEVKPRDASWFAYDVDILSPNEIEFTVFGMNHFNGRVGEVLYRIPNVEMEPEQLLPVIKRRILRLATEEYQKRIENAAQAKIREIANNIFEREGLSNPVIHSKPKEK